jgi:hypothetical protein
MRGRNVGKFMGHLQHDKLSLILPFSLQYANVIHCLRKQLRLPFPRADAAFSHDDLPMASPGGP